MKIALYQSQKEFIILPQEQPQGPRFKVWSEGLSPEIDILIQSPILVLTEAAVAYIDIKMKM